AADDGDRERLLHLPRGADPEREREEAEHRTEGRHDDRTKAAPSGFHDRDAGRKSPRDVPLSALDEEDSVLHDEPRQEDEADERRGVERDLEDEKRKE